MEAVDVGSRASCVLRLQKQKGILLKHYFPVKDKTRRAAAGRPGGGCVPWVRARPGPGQSGVRALHSPGAACGRCRMAGRPTARAKRDLPNTTTIATTTTTIVTTFRTMSGSIPSLSASGDRIPYSSILAGAADGSAPEEDSLGEGRRSAMPASASALPDLLWDQPSPLRKLPPDMPSPPRLAATGFPSDALELALSVPSSPSVPLPDTRDPRGDIVDDAEDVDDDNNISNNNENRDGVKHHGGNHEEEGGAEDVPARPRNVPSPSLFPTRQSSDKENAPPPSALQASTIPSAASPSRMDSVPSISSPPDQPHSHPIQATPAVQTGLFHDRIHAPLSVASDVEVAALSASALTASQQPYSGGLRERVQMHAIATSTPIQHSSRRAPLAPLEQSEASRSPPPAPAFATAAGADAPTAHAETHHDPLAGLGETDLVVKNAHILSTTPRARPGKTSKIEHWIQNVESPSTLEVSAPSQQAQVQAHPISGEPAMDEMHSSSDMFGILAEVRATARQTRRKGFRRISSSDPPAPAPGPSGEPETVQNSERSPDSTSHSKRANPSDPQESDYDHKRAKLDPKAKGVKDGDSLKNPGRVWGAGRAGKQVQAPPGLSQAASTFLQSLPRPGSSYLQPPRSSKNIQQKVQRHDPSEKSREYKLDKYVSLLPRRNAAAHWHKERASSAASPETFSESDSEKGPSASKGKTRPAPGRNTHRTTRGSARGSGRRGRPPSGRGRARDQARSVHSGRDPRGVSKGKQREPSQTDSSLSEPDFEAATEGENRERERSKKGDPIDRTSSRLQARAVPRRVGGSKRHVPIGVQSSSNEVQPAKRRAKPSSPFQANDAVSRSTQGVRQINSEPTATEQASASIAAPRRSRRAIRPPTREPVTLTSRAAAPSRPRPVPSPPSSSSSEEAEDETSDEIDSDQAFSPGPVRKQVASSSFYKPGGKTSMTRPSRPRPTSRTRTPAQKGSRTKGRPRTVTQAAVQAGESISKRNTGASSVSKGKNKRNTTRELPSSSTSGSSGSRRAKPEAEEDSLNDYKLDEEVVVW